MINVFFSLSEKSDIFRVLQQRVVVVVINILNGITKIIIKEIK